jgi:hypothetical protein
LYESSVTFTYFAFFKSWYVKYTSGFDTPFQTTGLIRVEILDTNIMKQKKEITPPKKVFINW